jgi:hypothetical protein
MDDGIVECPDKYPSRLFGSPPMAKVGQYKYERLEEYESAAFPWFPITWRCYFSFRLLPLSTLHVIHAGKLQPT